MMSTDIGDLFRNIVDEGDVQRDGDLSSYAVDGIVPKVALFPRDVEGVSRILTIAQREGLSVAPRGGGTKVMMGNPPRKLDVVLSLVRLNRVVEHQPGELTAIVEGGIKLQTLRQELEREGQFFPLDSPSFAQATIGGTLVCNVSGPRRLAHGTARDLLLGVKVVHADGRVTKAGGRVIKNVTGYDLNKLYVGSLGTLGIIVEASLKLAPLPSVERTLFGLFSSIQTGLRTAHEILNKGIEPLAICLLDGPAVQHLRDFDLTVGHNQVLLMVELGGRNASVASREAQVNNLFHQHAVFDISGLGALEGQRLWCAIGDLGCGRDPAAMVLRCGVHPGQIPNLYDALGKAFGNSGMTVGMVAQVGPGIVRALAWAEEEMPPPSDLVSLTGVLRQQVLSQGGYVVVERCPTTVKTYLDVWGDPGEGAGIMRRLKWNFDPKGVLNPGRFVGGI